MKRVLLVEDEPWVRQDVAHVLSGGDGALSIAAACATGEEALAAMARGVAFDLALVDLGLPGISGVEVIAATRRQRPQAVSVAFTIFEDDMSVIAAMRAGARGYLLKSTPLPRLRTALLAASEGDAPMTPSIARLVVDLVARTPPAPVPTNEPVPSLTPRERDVLALLARGHTYADTACALEVALSTVQTHVKNIYAKLEVASKAEAVAIALRLGLA